MARAAPPQRTTAPGSLFAFVQLELPFRLGPGDGRYLLRPAQDVEPERVIVLRIFGAPQRRAVRGRRGRNLTVAAEVAPVPTTRVTVIRPEPLPSATEAESWLARLQRDRDSADGELAAAMGQLNRLIRAYRVAAQDSHAHDVSEAQAIALRLGFGSGEEVAEGRFTSAWEPPNQAVGRRRRREALAPEERFAAILGGRDRPWACEELVLRARADLGAGRPREAALQARIALESLLAELGDATPSEVRAELEADRAPIGRAANAALRDDPPEDLRHAVEETVGRMEAAIRRRRLAPP